MSETTTLPIEDGTIENTNRWAHKRAKTWVAIVQKDKSQPGGLRRTFLDRAPGGRVFVGPTKPGDWLEFAGDYYTGGGSKRPDRKYYRVLERNGSLILEPCDLEDVGRKDEAPVVNPLEVYSNEDILAEAKRRGLIQ